MHSTWFLPQCYHDHHHHHGCSYCPPHHHGCMWEQWHQQSLVLLVKDEIFSLQLWTRLNIERYPHHEKKLTVMWRKKYNIITDFGKLEITSQEKTQDAIRAQYDMMPHRILLLIDWKKIFPGADFVSSVDNREIGGRGSSQCGYQGGIRGLMAGPQTMALNLSEDQT